MLYTVQATVTIRDGEWSTVRQIPTFVLDSSWQGITGLDHAEQVARDILTSANRNADVSVTVIQREA